MVNLKCYTRSHLFFVVVLFVVCFIFKSGNCRSETSKGSSLLVLFSFFFSYTFFAFTLNFLFFSQ